MASLLVIGVGSTGLSAMERAQQYYYELTKTADPGQNSAFMYLETDESRIAELAPNGKTKIQSCYLCPSNITATLTNWDNKQQWPWMPSTADVLNTHAGAAGQPAFGRVALWAEETNVRNMISQLYSKINGDSQTNIYLVGSLTGGTGTGIFLDLAYMVRQCTNNNNIYGMFMLPDRMSVGNSSMDMIYENAYSSVRSLDLYSKTNADGSAAYQCTLPGGTVLTSQFAPFYNVQFFSQDFSNASASLASLTQLVQSVGFGLALRMLDVTNQTAPFQAVVNAKLVDYLSHVPDGIFTSVGLNVFQYPEGLLEEYLTSKLLVSQQLERWADPTNYLDQHGTKYAIATVKARIKAEATRFVHEAVENAVSKCLGMQFLGKPTFAAALDAEIATIMSGNYLAPSLENYTFSLYDANSQAPNKFFAPINGQATSLRDVVIDQISAKIEEISTTYQNLTIVDMWLLEIADALEKLSQEWTRRYHIDGTPAQWNKAWLSLHADRLSGSFIYKMTGCTAEWYKEALGGVATLCSYNALVPMIKNMVDSILNRNGMRGISTAAGVVLPTKQDLLALFSKVARLLNPQDSLSMVARRDNLFGQMSNNAHAQIHYIFNGVSCTDDINVAEGKYNNGGKRLTFADLSGDTLWRFLYRNDVLQLKGIMLSQGLSFIQKLNLFADTDIVQNLLHMQPTHPAYNKVNNLLTGTSEVIGKDVPAMVSLVNTEQFQPHKCLRLIVASPVADNSASGIVAQMQGYQPSAASSNYVQLPSLKNTVVVYQEYGYLGSVNGVQKTFSPVLHLSYQQQVLGWIKQKLQVGAFDEKNRLAYIDKETLVDTTNIKIK